MIEPDDITFNLSKIEKQSSPPEDDSATMKDAYAAFVNLLASQASNVAYQVIPVGSYVIGCVTKNNMVVDCHLNIDGLANQDWSDESIAHDLKVKLDLVYEDPEKNDRPDTSCELFAGNKSTLIINDGPSKSSIRVFVSSSKVYQEDQRITRASAGIFHSNWLVETYNQSPNAWQTVKLFRMVRVWK